MKRLKKSIETERVVFKATIELNSEYREKFNSNSDYYDNSNRLKPNGRYWFGNKEEKVSYKELETLLTKTIERELEPKVNELLEDEHILGVKVISVNEGSIEIIFTVLVFAGKAILGGLVYDLIKHIAKELLTKTLTNYYGYFFDVDVSILSPSISRNRYEEKCGRGLPIIYDYIGSNKRGAFFYYLLFSNFFLMGIIMGIICYMAVTR